ncbi:MAG: hypothetical protein COV31_02680 [Candidatus Yanofskybacteria bacterium CG10_big_fil_rev_8_21_14_0_10_46_23]|uniref:Uncharacterized protein n=1 Tax=Candidatus Yanofskybacteria bacterium CG10_big_fil_rev_8_21_14_0_10_46_23 TaxID=1975098 RepID=A0A2H0R5I1_9BACT|nr:MAG: hypothetical protein COV31_02680 [Candidatus Yanofskybacteria bacterium CG10_big_fil_rev_8_21_14_0_10_46_23]
MAPRTPRPTPATPTTPPAGGGVPVTPVTPTPPPGPPPSAGGWLPWAVAGLALLALLLCLFWPTNWWAPATPVVATSCVTQSCLQALVDQWATDSEVVAGSFLRARAALLAVCPDCKVAVPATPDPRAVARTRPTPRSDPPDHPASDPHLDLAPTLAEADPCHPQRADAGPPFGSKIR